MRNQIELENKQSFKKQVEEPDLGVQVIGKVLKKVNNVFIVINALIPWALTFPVASSSTTKPADQLKILFGSSKLSTATTKSQAKYSKSDKPIFSYAQTSTLAPGASSAAP